MTLFFLSLVGILVCIQAGSLTSNIASITSNNDKLHYKSDKKWIHSDISVDDFELCDDDSEKTLKMLNEKVQYEYSIVSNKNNRSGPWNRQFTVLHDDGKRILNYYGLMVAGAIARATAATAVHPLNVIKTMLQTKDGKIPEIAWKTLTRGAGSQFVMSVPHGALNFAITETTKVCVTINVVNHKSTKQNIFLCLYQLTTFVPFSP
jgi:hypothetical protein